MKLARESGKGGVIIYEFNPLPRKLSPETLELMISVETGYKKVKIVFEQAHSILKQYRYTM